tara:strand:+ start:7398 stop:7592 length:195 start_codon:yes stop_codon:yes gene_type:complete
MIRDIWYHFTQNKPDQNCAEAAALLRQRAAQVADVKMRATRLDALVENLKADRIPHPIDQEEPG